MKKTFIISLMSAASLSISHAGVLVEVGQNNPGWTFPSLPAPKAGDVAESGSFSVVEGALNGNSAAVTVLNDGRKQDGTIDCCGAIPQNPDGINDSAWIAEGTSGKIMLSFTAAREIGSIRTYSWFELAGQNNARAAQKYRLYGSALESPQTSDAALATPDWSLIADVNTDSVTGAGAQRPAQIGVGVSAGGGASLGSFRHLLWDIDPVDGIGTFYGEFDADPPQSYSDLVRADAPIHYYRFEDSDPLLPVEDIGNPGGNPGTIGGGVILGESSEPLSLGNAARFDGASGTFVDLGLFHPGDAITVECWVKLDEDARASSYHSAVARWDGSYEIDFAVDEKANFVVRNDANVFGLAASQTPAVRGSWHHLVGIFSEGTLTIYLDGVKGTEQSVGGVLRDGGPDPDRILIGATRSGTAGSFNFKGLIDEVAIYDHALTEPQIVAHYTAAFPAVVPTVSIALKAELSWPDFPPGLVLQVSDTLTNPNWQDVVLETPPIHRGATFNYYVPVTEAQRFYRLNRP